MKIQEHNFHMPLSPRPAYIYNKNSKNNKSNKNENNINWKSFGQRSKKAPTQKVVAIVIPSTNFKLQILAFIFSFALGHFGSPSPLGRLLIGLRRSAAHNASKSGRRCFFFGEIRLEQFPTFECHQVSISIHIIWKDRPGENLILIPLGYFCSCLYGGYFLIGNDSKEWVKSVNELESILMVIFFIYCKA